MGSTNSRRVKVFAAVMGGSAVVALGALSTALADEQSGGQSGTVLAKANTMNVGATITETTPSSAPAISMAVPVMKGPAPLPSEESAAE